MRDVNAMIEQFLSLFSIHLDNICERIFSKDDDLRIRENSIKENVHLF